MLLRAEQAAGDDVPLSMGSGWWCVMRTEMKRGVYVETRVEFLRRGMTGRWKRRPVFVIGVDDAPAPYPEGEAIVEEIERKGLPPDDTEKLNDLATEGSQERCQW